MRVQLLADNTAARNPRLNPYEREDRLEALKKVALENAKLSRSATLASVSSDNSGDLSHLPPAYISFLQHANFSLELATEVREKDDRHDPSASGHTSKEGQTGTQRPGWDKSYGGSLNDPSSLVYRLSHR